MAIVVRDEEEEDEEEEEEEEEEEGEGGDAGETRVVVGLVVGVTKEMKL